MAEQDLLSQLRIDRSAQEAAPRRRWPWVLVAATLLAVLSVVLYRYQLGGQIVEVDVATAISATQAQPQASVLDASGYVVARRQATVSSKVTGKVIEVLIDEGMRVSEGQLMARLEATQQQADLALRQAQLQAARAQLGEIQAQLSNAESDLRRQQELFDRNLTSASGLDAARAQADALRARLASGRSQVEVSARTLAFSQVALDDTEIRAPFAGIIIDKAAQAGEMISPVSAGGGFTRTGIGTIVDMDSLEVEVDVNEAFIGRVASNMAAQITLNAYPDWKIDGQVVAVIPAADRTRATVRVRVAFLQRDDRIVPEMGVRVAFLEAEPEQDESVDQVGAGAVLVPASAIAQYAGEAVVFVFSADSVQRRSVRTGDSRGALRIVERGVQAGERVVISPLADLEDGQPARLEAGK